MPPILRAAPFVGPGPLSRAAVLLGLLGLMAAIGPVAAAAPEASTPGDEATAHALMRAEPPDWDAARRAFAGAAEAGSATAMAHLGWFHEQGHGVPVSAPLAAFWYEQAFHAGARHLALKLGWLYLGDGVLRDRALAERWFRRAIAAGDLAANVALASVLIADAQGGIDPERVDEALALLQPALDGGVMVASYFLARIHLEGIGTQPVDHRRGLAYAELGAAHGYPQRSQERVSAAASFVDADFVSAVPGTVVPGATR